MKRIQQKAETTSQIENLIPAKNSRNLVSLIAVL